MDRILITYYSLGGHTRGVAEEIQAATGADMDEIRDVRPRRGATGMLRALADAFLRRKPPVLAIAHDPRDYDLLVIGGPIWARRFAAPVRTFAEHYGPRAKRIAFFCTEGGNGDAPAYGDLERLSQRRPAATLTVDAAHLEPAAHRAELTRFVTGLQRPDVRGGGDLGADATIVH